MDLVRVRLTQLNHPIQESIKDKIQMLQLI